MRAPKPLLFSTLISAIRFGSVSQAQHQNVSFFCYFPSPICSCSVGENYTENSIVILIVITKGSKAIQDMWKRAGYE